MSDEQDRIEAELWWQAKALMAICDQAETWQTGDGSIYDPPLVKVSDAARVVGRVVADEIDRRDHGYVRIKLDDALVERIARKLYEHTAAEAGAIPADEFFLAGRPAWGSAARAVVAALREAAQ